MAQGTDVKKLRDQVIQNLDQAQESLIEAHMICHEKLYPTWQTVDQDIQMLLRSVQALSIDLKRRNSDTSFLKESETEPVESPSPKASEKIKEKPARPASKSPEKKKVKPMATEHAPQKKQKARAVRSSPALQKKQQIQEVEPIPSEAETKKVELASDNVEMCPWCDSQHCEVVDAVQTTPSGTKEKVLVCLECGQTYSASTLENT